MKLYEVMKLTMGDYDTYDTIYDTCITVCYIDENEMEDSYDKFCVSITKKVDINQPLFFICFFNLFFVSL